MKKGSGMGSHKHGTSGKCGPTSKYKFLRTLESNKEIEEEEERKRKKENMEEKFESVSELMKHKKKH
ncbi:MAG: hypothetical protein NT098_01905 [Candidatus Parcubacteria bacterium]|nr:hypothetical protein [Candidatus Parcubacteria bacterium]